MIVIDIPVFKSKVGTETVEPQEIPFKVCVMFYNALSDKLYRDFGEKKKFSGKHLIYPNVWL